ncbi:septum formation initiator family protein [Pelosinus sp. sgz500959]|uniref:FtsB family cell division protein n=1 Tax=Pelosinus sp. sgz500959 TaxID=3242472 RepID=UPI0036710FE8
MQILRKYRVKWFRIITFILSAYFIYVCIGQQTQLNAISNEADSVHAQLTQIQQLNVALKEERNALNDRRYVEKIAREELGLVKPGEIPYIMADKK